MLKSQYASKEEIPAAHAELYSERNGAWVLTGVEGIKTQADVDNVRGALQKERDARAAAEAAAKRFSAIGDRDIDQLIADSEELAQIRDQGAAAPGKDPAAEQRRLQMAISREVNPLKRKLEAVEAEANKYKQLAEQYDRDIKDAKIVSALQSAAMTKKLRGEAHDDVLLYRNVFEVADDGRVTTRAGAGVTPGLDPESWLADILPKKPHWQPTSHGGGAGGSNGAGPPVANYFSKEKPNITKAAQLMATDRAKADQMAQQAGYANADLAVKAMGIAASKLKPEY